MKEIVVISDSGEGEISIDNCICDDDNLAVTGMLADDDLVTTGVNITPCEEEDDESDKETDVSLVTCS